MVFHGDIAIALTLIALGVGYLVLVKARKQESNGTKTIGLIIGWIVIVVAAITLLCASYYSVRYWDDGAYSTPGPMMMQWHGMSQGGPMAPGMMGGGMMAPGMMRGKMMQNGMMGKNCQPTGNMNGQCQQMQGQVAPMNCCKSGMHKGGHSGTMKDMMHPDTTED